MKTSILIPIPVLEDASILFFIIARQKLLKHLKIQAPLQTGGAGIKAGELLANKDVQVLITGNVGPNAFDVLKAADIKIATKASGKVSDVIINFEKGELEITDSATVKSHSGMDK